MIGYFDVYDCVVFVVYVVYCEVECGLEEFDGCVCVVYG